MVRASLVMIGLVILSPISLVQAANGAALFDGSTWSIEAGMGFSGSDLPFTVEVTEVHGGEANITVHITASSLEGDVLFNQSTAIGLTASQILNFSSTITGLPYGFAEVRLEMFGDVGVNSSSLTTELVRVVQRLRPSNVTFGGASSLLVEGVLSNGTATGNTTLHDGDFFTLQFPLINNGDLPWIGDVDVWMGTSAITLYDGTIANISVNASASTVVDISPGFQLQEGLMLWEMNLTQTDGGSVIGRQMNGTIEILPPPLPRLAGELVVSLDGLTAGQAMNATLRIWNNGSASFEASIVCSSPMQEVFSQPITLGVGGSWNVTFPLIAQPMVITCSATGGRIDASSTFPVSLDINVPSAVFEPVGANSPSYSGGPWHKGDVVHANLLVRNIGEEPGRVRLVLVQNGSIATGDWISLNEGSAGEVRASSQVLVEGPFTLNWSLESEFGAFQGLTNATTSFVAHVQQSVAVSITEISLTPDGSYEVVYLLELDEGRERDVKVKLGYESGGSNVYLLEMPLTLQPGVSEHRFDLGKVNAEQAVLTVEAQDWLVGPGRLSTNRAIPSADRVHWVEFDPVTSPLRPVEGESVQVTLTFQRSGAGPDESGPVWLVDAYGTILAQAQSPSWANGEDTARLTMAVNWPKGSSVGLRVIWEVAETTVTSEIAYVSGEPVTQSTLEVPWSGILWGVAIGACIVLVLRLRLGHQGESPSRTSSGQSPSRVNRSSNEKREVTCPECQRRLRVPVTYSGSVGCPDCSSKFEVEPAGELSETQPTLTSPSPEEHHTDPEPTVVEAKDGKREIGCPSCEQTLRVPSSYLGSVRCPACTTIFKADEAAKWNE